MIAEEYLRHLVDETAAKFPGVAFHFLAATPADDGFELQQVGNIPVEGVVVILEAALQDVAEGKWEIKGEPE